MEQFLRTIQQLFLVSQVLPLAITRRSGRLDCAIRLRLPSSRARAGSLSTMSEKAPGKRLMMASSARTTRGAFAKDSVHRPTRIIGTHYLNMDTAGDQRPAVPSLAAPSTILR